MVDHRRGAVQAADRSGLSGTVVPEARIIRRARGGDVDALIGVAIASYREHFADFWTPAGLEGFLARQFDRERLLRELAGESVRYDLVAHAGALVGYSKVLFGQPVPLQQDRRGLELQKIYFRRAATGHGHGGALLARLVEVARDAGEPCIWLNVLATNPHAARFYERHGYARTGSSAFSSDKGTTDMLVMQRTLDESADPP